MSTLIDERSLDASRVVWNPGSCVERGIRQCGGYDVIHDFLEMRISTSF